MKKKISLLFILFVVNVYSQHYKYTGYVYMTWTDQGWLYKNTNFDDQHRDYDFSVIKNVPDGTITMIYKHKMIPSNEMVEMIPTYKILGSSSDEKYEYYGCHDKYNDRFLLFWFSRTDNRMIISEGCNKDFSYCGTMKKFSYSE